MWQALAGAAVGGIAGGQKDKQQTVAGSSYADNINLRDFNDLNRGRSGLEEAGYNQQVSGFNDLIKLLQGGPGQAEVTADREFQNYYGNELQNRLMRMANPNAATRSEDAAYARQAFAPQYEQLSQQFKDQSVESNRLAARLGRAGNDPVLRNKMLQEQSRQTRMLDAQVGQYALQRPQQQFQEMADMGGYLAQVRSGLATQAMNNRMTLMNLGQQLANSERNYRLQAAGHSGTKESDTSTYSGGGFKGAMTGAMSGASMGMGFMGGGGGAATSMAGQSYANMGRRA